jgi:hypothetical protein
MSGSRALFQFKSLEAQAAVISSLKPNGSTPRSGRRSQQAYIYQAALAAHVASWDSYVNFLVEEFYTKLVPLGGPVPILHDIAHDLSAEKIKRFNTPNAENTRQLLMETMKYDPWPDWNWKRAARSSLSVRIHLNEILKIRHSFAHGFSMPGFGWNQSASGEVRLDSRAISRVRLLLRFVVTATDRGVHEHLSSRFRVSTGWYL